MNDVQIFGYPSRYSTPNVSLGHICFLTYTDKDLQCTPIACWLREQTASPSSLLKLTNPHSLNGRETLRAVYTTGMNSHGAISIQGVANPLAFATPVSPSSPAPPFPPFRYRSHFRHHSIMPLF